MIRKLLFTASLCALCTFMASGQQQRSIPKLVIPKGQTYQVSPGNTLVVDTLIMHDRSIIAFDPTLYGILEARVAYVGDKCVISSSGADGKMGKHLEQGEDGKRGGSLSLVMHFASLGQLTIDTRGGNGGNGANGRNGKLGTQDTYKTRTFSDSKGNVITEQILVPGIPGTDGTDATQGGNGGSGGNLSFTYSTQGFMPVFNRPDRNANSIIIENAAGRSGDTGEPGKGGYTNMDGTIRVADIKKPLDGYIQLINLNNPNN